VARTTLLGRVAWYVAAVIERRDESETARTLVLKVPQWPGHDAGQHVDVRLTAADGYTAVRSYSIANATQDDLLELTVEQVPDGEVSPYLARTLSPGDPLEIRGPLGGWFVWHPVALEPVQLVAGGSGIVPLMAMIRTRAQAHSRAPFRLIYSVRSPGATMYAGELRRRALEDDGLAIAYVYTRATPPDWPRPTQRINATTIAESVFPAGQNPACFVCGPTAFVEAASGFLKEAGYNPTRIKTERFGPSGGTS
jgi:ferredoxin-NADP reductase